MTMDLDLIVSASKLCNDELEGDVSAIRRKDSQWLGLIAVGVVANASWEELTERLIGGPVRAKLWNRCRIRAY